MMLIAVEMVYLVFFPAIEPRTQLCFRLKFCPDAVYLSKSPLN